MTDLNSPPAPRSEAHEASDAFAVDSDVAGDAGHHHPAHASNQIAAEGAEGAAVAGRHEPTPESLSVDDLLGRRTGAEQRGHSAADGAAHPNGGAGRPVGGPAQHKWWTLVAVCLGTFMLLLDVTIVNVALPDIQTALRASFSDLQWVVDAYALTLAALLLTAGSLADIFGRRKLYIIGLSIFTLASLLCGSAQNTLVLQLSRAAQGVGGAIMFSVSLALLADAFRGKDRGVAFGIWGAITGLAVALGPLVGGALTTGFSWRWIFFVNLPVGIAAVVLSVLRVSESKAPYARRPDWAGFVVFSVALASLVYGLIEANERSFSDARVISCLVAAAVLLVVFVVLEAVSKSPMFDLSLFRLPTFSGGAIAAFGLSSTVFAMFLYLTLYLQDVLHFNAFNTGIRLLVMSGAILAVSTVAGRVTEHVQVRLLIGPGLVIIGVGLLMMRGLDATSTWTHLVAGLLISGCGIGLVNPPLASTAVGVVAPQRSGMASGVNSTFRQVGLATGIALLGTLFSSKVKSEVMSLAASAHLPIPASKLATAVQGGAVSKVLAAVPATARGSVERLTTTAFTTGLNYILLVAGIVAVVAGVLAFGLIRQKDFVAQGGH